MSSTPRRPAGFVRRHPAIVTGTVGLVLAGVVTPVALAAQNTPRSVWPAGATLPTGPNLAKAGTVVGSSPCRADEAAAKAIDGAAAGLRDKWCSRAGSRYLRIDLGAVTAVSAIVVRHAGAGGEPVKFNSRAFDLRMSADRKAFTTVASITGNKADVTVHTVTGSGRYVELDVKEPEQSGKGAARIYEVEVYGKPATVPPPPSPSPSVPVPSPSPTPSTTPAPPKPSPSKPGTDPGPVAGCFPYPERDPGRGPNPKIVSGPGVPPLDAKYLNTAKKMWQEEWPGAWQRFAPPSLASTTKEGVFEVQLNTQTQAVFGGGVLELPYKDLIGGVDGQDFGSWMHESAHMVQIRYPDNGVPALYAEGITDFIRFVAHGEDPKWKVVGLNDAGSDAFQAQRVWDGGYRVSARFLLWVTQHYDKSGAKYQLVHDLNAGASTTSPDWKGMFVKLTGKTFEQLVAEYAQDRKINPHC